MGTGYGIKKQPARRPSSSRNQRPRSAGKNGRSAWSPGHRSQQRVFQETFVYVMTNFPFFMLNKFGITDKTTARRKNVSDTTPGEVQTILSMNLAFGYNVEQFVHRLYRFQNIHFWTGSGRTEWFIVFSPITGVALWYLDYRFGFQLTTKQLAFGFFTPFVWWDGILWLLFFRALKLFFIIGAVFFVMWFIANMK